MEPIIDPMFFYWLQIVDVLRGTFAAVSLIYLVAICTLAVAWVEDDSAKKPFKILLWFIPLAVIMGLTAIFLPSSDTLIKMKMAEHATPDNIKTIMQTAKEIKQGLKEDVIEIIRESKEKE